MSDRGRLRDEGPDDVRALLRAARPTRGMTEAERARSRARVAGIAAAGAAAASLSWAPAAAFGAGLGAVVVVAWTVVPGLVAPAPAPTAPSAVVAPPRAPSAPRPAPIAPSATAPVDAPPVAAPPGPSPAPAPSPSARAAPPAHGAPDDEPAPPAIAAPPPPPAPPREGDSLAREAALLERARVALGASPADALALAGAHAAEFPAGKLSMERELVAIDALGRLGRAGEARARAESLLPRARGSLYEARLRALVPGLAEKSTGPASNP